MLNKYVKKLFISLTNRKYKNFIYEKNIYFIPRGSSYIIFIIYLLVEQRRWGGDNLKSRLKIKRFGCIYSLNLEKVSLIMLMVLLISCYNDVITYTQNKFVWN